MKYFINIAHAGVITDAPLISDIGIKILYFLLSVTGIIAMIALALAGMMYFFSVGDEKKMQVAKKVVSFAILGVVLAMGAMVVVRMIGQFFSAA